MPDAAATQMKKEFLLQNQNRGLCCDSLQSYRPWVTIIARSMARGWESKAIEAQQAEAAEKPQPRPRLSPEERAKVKEREGLELSRKRILRQIADSTKARHRKMLEDALAELDARLSQL